MREINRNLKDNNGFYSLLQFNHFVSFASGLFAELVGFAFIFVIGDDKVRIFYDVAATF